jgi:hypothetical protein
MLRTSAHAKFSFENVAHTVFFSSIIIYKISTNKNKNKNKNKTHMKRMYLLNKVSFYPENASRYVRSLRNTKCGTQQQKQSATCKIQTEHYLVLQPKVWIKDLAVEEEKKYST